MPRTTETLGAPAVDQGVERGQIFARNPVDFRGKVEGVSVERAIEADRLIRVTGAFESSFEALVIVKMIEDDEMNRPPDTQKAKSSQSSKAE